MLLTIPHDHPSLPGHFPGRPVVLSRGYGMQARLVGLVKSFECLPFPPGIPAWERAYGVGPLPKVAAITLDLRFALVYGPGAALDSGWPRMNGRLWDIVDDHAAMLEKWHAALRGGDPCPAR